MANRNLAPDFVRHLDTLRQAAVMLGEDNETFRKSVAAELSATIDALSRKAPGAS